MAECSGSQLTVNWFGLETRKYNLSDWKNGQNPDEDTGCLVSSNDTSMPDGDQNKGGLVSSSTSVSDHQKRSEIVHAIIHNQSLDHLESILGSGWDVNEILRIPDYELRKDEKGSEHLDYNFEQRTALGEAVGQGWTEGVKMLLDADAECKTTDALRNPLTLALQNCDCPSGLIELLLNHGLDPNDHNKELEDIPLLLAINNCNQGSKIVKLLLEHGADPNVTGRRMAMVPSTALHEAIRRGWTEGVKILLDAGAKCKLSDKLDNTLTLAIQNGDPSPDLIKLLLNHGADPNFHPAFHRSEEDIPLLCAITDCRNNVHLSEIVKLLLEHGANPNVSGMVCVMKKWLRSTPLYEAARRRWTEGMMMLLDAGAECKTSSTLQNILIRTLKNRGCPVNLIELLLKRGADPNHHDGTEDNVPLLKAISNCRCNPALTKIVEMLLEHGANPNVRERNSVRKPCSLSAVLDLEGGVCATLFKTLVDFGSHVNFNAAGYTPLLQRMMFRNHYSTHYVKFSKCQVDLYFLHGGNVNIECNDRRIALEYAVMNHANSNIIRWLIRHGADASPMKVTLLKYQSIPYLSFPETPVILLQAGMRVSHGAQTQLKNLQMAIAVWLQDGSDEDNDLWAQLQKFDEGERQRMQHTFRKANFPEYWTRQLADLQKFSGESLQLYPEDTYVRHTGYARQRWENIIDQIQRVLQFLSQPQSLQWYCRCCVRESLVSLQPSVVKTLSIPAVLRRYILCHEI